MKKFDILIVGGGIVSSYIIKRIKGCDLKIAIIDKFDCINDDIEKTYYEGICGYRDKKFGGLSEFWGGQIQDIDFESILSILNLEGIECTKSEFKSARDRVIKLLKVELNESSLSEKEVDSKYKRVLNSWIGKSRLLGRDAGLIIDKNKITLKQGKVNKITFDNFKNVYRIELVDNNYSTDILYSNKVFFCGGVLGLAEYILGINSGKILNYRDHYSIAIANISKFSDLGKLITPYFLKRKLITPRIYFTNSEFSNNLSLYSTLPFQKELGEMRNAKKKSIFSVLLYILGNKNFFSLSFFVLRMGYSFLLDKKVPLKANRLDINALIDTNLLKNGAIRVLNKNTCIGALTKSDFIDVKNKVFEKLIKLDSKKYNILGSQSQYFECAYHAYCLSDHHGFNASKELTDIGVNVFCPSELRNIGDRNPVFTTLVLTELKINKLNLIE